MSYKLLIILMAMAAMGCGKNDIPDALFVPSDDKISFKSEDNWGTKSTIIYESTLDEMEVFAFYTEGDDWSEATSPKPFMINQSVDFINNVWSYSPIKYWPSNDTDKISFFAFAPDHTIAHNIDSDTGKPTFSHTLSPLALENEDLLAAFVEDKTNGSGNVEFPFVHALTKVTLKAKLIDSSLGSRGESEITNEKYIIDDISISGIYPKRSLDVESMVWSDPDMSKSTIIVTASQGVALKSKDDYNLGGYDVDGNYIPNDTPTDVMVDGQAIFLLPQKLESGNLPKLQLRIRRSYEIEGKTVERVYQTVLADFPTTTADGTPMTEWKMGQSIELTFSFDIGELDEYETPLTVTSKIFGWAETDVVVDMHNNIYIYSSKSKIEAEEDADNNLYGEFMICTNYGYNLRVPHHREELDGSITSSRGFLFYSNDFDTTSGTLEVGTETIKGDEYKVFIPTLLIGKDGKEVNYVYKEKVADNATIYEYQNGYTGNAADRTTITGEIVYGSHDLVYIKDGDLYRLLYHDPNNNSDLTAFNYNDDGEIKLTAFADIDEDNHDTTVYFDIKITDSYIFDFQVTKSTRGRRGLYVSGAVGGDSSHGVNKSADDPVYILRLSVNKTHLDAAGEIFDDKIGAEMISNGGGMITKIFSVILTDKVTN